VSTVRRNIIRAQAQSNAAQINRKRQKLQEKVDKAKGLTSAC